MLNRESINLTWWRLACEESPEPIAFIDTNNNFIFCNKAYCELVGYSETELREMKWQDITKKSDVGADDCESKLLATGNKSEYYIEKTYLRKDNTEVAVALYVHRYPEFGAIEGYVVFSRRLSSKEYQDLKQKFHELHQTVLLLQQNAIIAESIFSKMQIMESEIKTNRDITQSLLGKTSINIGDKVGGDLTGRDKISNQSVLLIVFGVCLSILLLGVSALVAGGHVRFGHGGTNIEVNK